MSNGNGQVQNAPLALARPTLMIEVALPDGNKFYPVEVCRELHQQLGLALNQIDATAQEAAKLRDTGADLNAVPEGAE